MYSVVRYEKKRYGSTNKPKGSYFFKRSAIFYSPDLAKFLMYLYREQLKVHVAMASIETMASEIHVQFDARWHPHHHIGAWKAPPRVFDYFMLQPKTDLRYGLDEVGFHTPHLIGVGQNPSPTSQPEEILLSVYSEGAHKPRLLLEPNLPGRLSVPASKSLTAHLKVLGVIRMKNEQKGECIHNCHMI
jgi:hypothetical protein